MATYTKTRSGAWAVIGAVNEVVAGRVVTVTLKNGTTKTEYIASVGSSFTGKYGPLKGENCRYGYPGKKSRAQTYTSEYCWYPCPVTRLKCSPENGPCHDCV